MSIGERVDEYQGCAKKCFDIAKVGAKEVFLPDANRTPVGCYYTLARSLHPKIQILPDVNEDTFTSSVVKGSALFVSGIALHYLSFWGTIWRAWGVVTNTHFYLYFEMFGKRKIFGIEKTQVSNNMKSCLIQSIFDFALYQIPWWALGIGLASGILTYRLFSKNTYPVEFLQNSISSIIEKWFQCPLLSESPPGNK